MRRFFLFSMLLVFCLAFFLTFVLPFFAFWFTFLLLFWFLTTLSRFSIPCHSRGRSSTYISISTSTTISSLWPCSLISRSTGWLTRYRDCSSRLRCRAFLIRYVAITIIIARTWTGRRLETKYIKLEQNTRYINQILSNLILLHSNSIATLKCQMP